MARRGVLAEINRQVKASNRRHEQAARAAATARARARREAEQAAARAEREAERARKSAATASEKERRAADKEALRLLVMACEAEAAALTAEVEAVYEDIDTLLSATFGVDDYVDLEELRVTAVEHPPFEAGSLAQPSAPVPPLQLPPAPAPPAPQRKGLLTSAKKHDERAAAAQTRHQEEVARWQAHNDNMRRSHADAVEARERAEQDRLAALAAAQRAYEDACRQREAEAAAQNAELDRFINELAFDVEAAIQEYVGIVLSNSAYPDTFPVQHSHSFDISTRELTLEVSVPEPGTVPTTKAFRYVKAKNEVTETALPQKEQKERYANAVWQVGLRTLHEVFEADRAGRIHSIALTVGTRAVVPATGREEFIPLLVVGAERETFTTFDLSNVVPAATLEHMGAAMSKSPRDLVPADTTRGVRRRSS